jgi:hypothetical protein
MVELRRIGLVGNRRAATGQEIVRVAIVLRVTDRKAFIDRKYQYSLSHPHCGPRV